MAFTHSAGWCPPSGRQLKMCSTIDQELIDLFKSIVAQKAMSYERRCVAPMGRKIADETKAVRMLESMRRFEDTTAGRRWRYKRARGFL